MSPLRTVLLIAFVSAFLAVTGCRDDRSLPARSDTSDVATDDAAARIDEGHQTYVDFCASCHGIDGRGDGPVADYLTVPVPDLTRLRVQNNGIYPAEQVYATIDGTDDVRGHGTREMPVWGNVWIEENGEPVRLELVQERINELVEYIRTLQTDSADTLWTTPS